MKHRLLLAIACLCVFLFVGCGSEPSSNGQTALSDDYNLRRAFLSQGALYVNEAEAFKQDSSPVIVDLGESRLHQSYIDDLYRVTNFIARDQLSDTDKETIGKWLAKDYELAPDLWVKSRIFFAKIADRIDDGLSDAQAESFRIALYNVFDFYLKENKSLNPLTSFKDLYQAKDPVFYADKTSRIAIPESAKVDFVLDDHGDNLLLRQDENMWLDLAALLAVEPLSDDDRQDIREWLLDAFNESPEALLAYREALSLALGQSYSLHGDLFGMVQWRERTYGVFYNQLSRADLKGKALFLEVVARHNPVFAHRTDEPVIATQSFVNFQLVMYEIVASMVGETPKVNNTVKKQAKEFVIEFVEEGTHPVPAFVDLRKNTLNLWFNMYGDDDRATQAKKMAEIFDETDGDIDKTLAPVSADYVAYHRIQANQQVMKAFQSAMNSSLNTMQQSWSFTNRLVEESQFLQLETGKCVLDDNCLGVSVYSNGDYLGGVGVEP